MKEDHIGHHQGRDNRDPSAAIQRRDGVPMLVRGCHCPAWQKGRKIE